MPHILPTQFGYDRWSAIYDLEDNPLIHLEEPVVEKLIGDVSGLDVADLGCGTGRWSLRLAEKGARVTAIDFSEGMLDKAKAKPGSEKINFLIHDLSGDLPLKDSAFDLVICCLVLDHIEHLDHIFFEMKRIARPDGVVVVSVMHPAMMLLDLQARFFNPETGQEIRPKSAENQISDYVLAAGRAGFSIDRMSEHQVDADLASKVPRAQKYLGWSMLLAMRLCA